MDFPCLLGRTLNGLMVLVKSPDGVNCFSLSVHLAACLFDSPAALYLFVSARICSPPPIPLNPQPPALLKTLHFISLCPTSGSLICWTRIWPPVGPNRRYCLSPLFGMCCVWPSSGVLCFIIHNCAGQLMLEHSQQQQEFEFTSGYFGASLSWMQHHSFCMSVSYFLNTVLNTKVFFV